MLDNRFDEQEVRELVLLPGALGYCQYEGEKPEQGYLVIARLPDGEVRMLGRRELQRLRMILGCASH